MQLIPLEVVRHQVHVGVPLPFSVRLADSTLLLARGQVVGSTAQMHSLFERGMFVDMAELKAPPPTLADVPAEQLPGLWTEAIDRVGRTLASLPEDGLDGALDEVALPLISLIARDPDLAIFQVLRQHGSRHAQYGVNHSIHCAIAAFLTAQRLGWDAAALGLAFKAALTMNVSMLELQGQLATQVEPLTPDQRELIRSHPLRSVEMLRMAGITDAAWLQAIAEHHETPAGSGYPAGVAAASPLAALLHQSDVYTAKLSPRQSREGLTADVAARGLFASRQGDPTAAALIKEFGLYPPGCFVRLASGETGIVVRRGPSAHTPVVAAMTSPRGVSLRKPVRRDTAMPQHAIVAALSEGKAPFGGGPALLSALSCA